jgi:hypothetical protein
MKISGRKALLHVNCAIALLVGGIGMSSHAVVTAGTRAARTVEGQTDQLIIQYKPSGQKTRQLELPDVAEA